MRLAYTEEYHGVLIWGNQGSGQEACSFFWLAGKGLLVFQELFVVEEQVPEEAKGKWAQS